MAKMFEVTEIMLGCPSPQQKLEAAREAFLESLDDFQRKCFDHRSTFVITDPSATRWAITQLGNINCQDRDETYFLRIYNINIWEELAIKKSWMETCPEQILSRAARLKFSTDQELQMRPEQNFMERVRANTPAPIFGGSRVVFDPANYSAISIQADLKPTQNISPELNHARSKFMKHLQDKIASTFSPPKKK